MMKNRSCIIIRRDENHEFIQVNHQPALQNQIFTVKSIAVYLWNQKDVYYELLQPGETVIAERYQ